MQRARRKRDWRPVREGRVYCSPGCGAGCTHEDFVKATSAAKDLCARLAKTFGRGWHPVVWENLGWHYGVRKGNCHVHVHTYTCSPPSYWAEFDSSNGQMHQITSLGLGSRQTDQRSPEAAVKILLNRARAWARAIRNSILELEDK